ncbi:uncharacterized protein LOC144433339 [Glandiceps talaboti]
MAAPISAHNTLIDLDVAYDVWHKSKAIGYSEVPSSVFALHILQIHRQYCEECFPSDCQQQGGDRSHGYLSRGVSQKRVKMETSTESLSDDISQSTSITMKYMKSETIDGQYQQDSQEVTTRQDRYVKSETIDGQYQQDSQEVTTRQDRYVTVETIDDQYQQDKEDVTTGQDRYVKSETTDDQYQQDTGAMTTGQDKHVKSETIDDQYQQDSQEVMAGQELGTDFYSADNHQLLRTENHSETVPDWASECGTKNLDSPGNSVDTGFAQNTITCDNVMNSMATEKEESDGNQPTNKQSQSLENEERNEHRAVIAESLISEPFPSQIMNVTLHGDIVERVDSSYSDINEKNNIMCKTSVNPNDKHSNAENHSMTLRRNTTSFGHTETSKGSTTSSDLEKDTTKRPFVCCPSVRMSSTVVTKKIDRCGLCDFDFLEEFVNNKGKLGKGYLRKRRLQESDRICLSSCLNINIDKSASICIVCQGLCDKFTISTQRIKEVTETLASKVAHKSRKRVQDSPTEMTPVSKRPNMRTFSPVIKVTKMDVVPPMQLCVQATSQQSRTKQSTPRRLISLPVENTQIQITIAYRSKTTEKIIEPAYHGVATAIVSQDSNKLVKRAVNMNIDALSQHLKPIVAAEVRACVHNYNSVFRQSHPEGFQDSSFQEIFNEVNSTCPVLFSAICSAMRINSDSPTDMDVFHFGCAVAPILKYRSAQMSALAYHVGFILKRGGLSQKSHRQLCTMGYAISPSSIDTKVHELNKANEEDAEDLLTD